MGIFDKPDIKYKLDITSFGKFVFKDFDIASTTVFFGGNESGKSTMFDALLSSFSKVDKTKYSAEIKKRYGKKIAIDLTPTIDEDDKMPLAMYLNMYSVRQGDVVMEISDNNEWQKIIRTKLYDSDIDIDSLIDSVIAEKDSNAKGSINNERSKLNDMYARGKDTLASLNAEKNRIRTNLKEVQNKIGANNILKKKSDEDIRALDYTKEIIEKQDDVVARKRYLTILSNIDKHQKLNEYIRKNSVYSNNLSDQVLQMENDIIEYDRTIEFLRDKYSSLCKDKNQDEAFLNDRERNKILDKIDKAILRVDKERTAVYKKNILAKYLPSMFISVACLALFAFLNEPMYLFGFLSFILIFLPRKTIDYNQKALREIVAMVSELQFDLENIESVEDIYETLLIARQNILEIEPQKESIYNEMLSMIDTVSHLKNDLANILRASGVQTVKAYLDNVNFYNESEQSFEELSNQLRDDMNTFGVNNTTMLEVEISRLLKEFDKREVSHTGMSEEELFIKKNNYKRKLEEVNARYSGILEKEREYIKEMSFIEGELSSYPAKIVALESEIKNIELQMQAVDKDATALNVLVDMLERMRSKNNQIFEELKLESVGIFNKMLSSNRYCEMNDFDTKNMNILDKNDTMVNIACASTATRAAFLLSLKLTLMTKMGTKDKVILLDEPFITFDAKREIDTLTFLKEFAESHQIPIVFFTKDESTKNNIVDIFDNVLVNDLNLIK